MSASPSPVSAVPVVKPSDAAASRAEDWSTDLLNHARALHESARRLELTARLDLFNFALALRGRGRYYDLFPQFSRVDGGQQHYAPVLRTGGPARFIGWLPYFNKSWPLATEKLRFKEFCAANGLRTPRHWRLRDASVRDVIVKKSRSSFGAGIRGPFARSDDTAPEMELFEGEYYEQFVIGTIAKAWYWDDTPVCLETCRMPSVTGDGRRSFDALVAAGAPRSREPLPRDNFEALARYQGIALDEVLPAGKTVLADFRYTSPLLPRARTNSNVLPRYAGTEIARQLAEAGAVLWRAIPQELRRGTAWTLDAIIEEDAGRVWLLEMNCNPTLHPDIYPPIVDALFGPQAEELIAAAREAMRAPGGSGGAVQAGVSARAAAPAGGAQL